MVQLKAFDKFSSTADALGAMTALVDGKLSKGLRKFVKAQCSNDTLAVADSKLGSIVKEKLVRGRGGGGGRGGDEEGEGRRKGRGGRRGGEEEGEGNRGKKVSRNEGKRGRGGF